MTDRAWLKAHDVLMRHILVAFLIAGIGGVPAAAQDTAGVLEVLDIRVDVSDVNAEVARDKALATSERLAYEKLIERLAAPRDVPRLMGAADREISNLVKDFWISEEKVSPVRYVATVNYTFYRDRVYTHMRAKNAAAVPLPTEPMLVIPVYDKPAGTEFWGSPNEWRTAWRAVSPTSLLPMRFPIGDATDQGTLTADQALAPDGEAVRRLADRYAARASLVTIARAEGGDGGAPAVIRVETVRFPSIPPSIPVAEYTRGEAETEEQVLRRAVDGTIAALEAAWRSTGSTAGGTRQTLPVAVPVRAFEDWHSVRKRLNATSAIDDIAVVVLSRQEVRANITYFGDLETLRATLSGAGLTLFEMDGQWMLADVGRALPAATPGSRQQ